ncbi:MAG: hypothetical protein H6605_07205 [Flavobacteriales bacterium]|nr:hypothetical protein [Flavobacteriales bacterium]
MSAYHKKLIQLTFICAGILFVADASGKTSIGWIGWVALGFFVLLTLALNSLSMKAKEKNNSRFVTGMMGTTGLRMLSCIIFILIYWILAGKRDLYFIGYFFILYLFFTMFEILFLVHKLRADKKDEVKSETN